MSECEKHGPYSPNRFCIACDREADVALKRANTLLAASTALLDAIDEGSCEVPAQQYLDLKAAVALVRR